MGVNTYQNTSKPIKLYTLMCTVLFYVNYILIKLKKKLI